MSLTSFETAYQLLNPEQKLAVDTLEGVVVVIAGPGSGKTQLLSVRVVNILKKTDTLPSSIACLTFTEAAAANMRKRLSTMVGIEVASQISIHTFHSFAIEILNTDPTRHTVKPLSELDALIILEEGIKKLSPHSLFRSYHAKTGYLYLKEIKQRILELKRAGLTSNDYEVLHNQTIDWQEQNLDFFSKLLSNIKKTTSIHLVEELIGHMEIHYPNNNVPLIKMLYEELTITRTQLIEKNGATGVLTVFKKRWFIKKDGVLTWKYLAKKNEWLDLLTLYNHYQLTLEERGVIDFEDMILNAVTYLKNNPDMLLALQERYLYLLVDEFQDNTLAQNELINLLGNNTLNEGNPNILVVGDDDQAIYKFGGAHSNVLTQFVNHYPKAVTIALKNNYRSSKPIVESANALATTISSRFLPDKTIVSQSDTTQAVFPQYSSFTSRESQYISITSSVANLINQGVEPKNIAILSRSHRSLKEIVPFFALESIAVEYDYSFSLLDHPLIELLTKLCRYCTHSFWQGNPPDFLLASVLAHPAFGIDRIELWKLSLLAYKSSWLSVLIGHEKSVYNQIGNLLLEVTQKTETHSAHQLLGILLGLEPTESGYTSPVKEYYYNLDQLLESSKKIDYQVGLQGLVHLLSLCQSHTARKTITLHDLTKTLLQAEGLHYTFSSNIQTSQSTNSVSLLTAHKAKGLEFEYVFVVDCSYKEWYSKRQLASKLAWPPHCNFSPTADDVDDITRILYVATTRAKTHLYCSYCAEEGEIAALTGYTIANQLEEPIVTKHWEAKLITPQFLPIENLFLQERIDNFRFSTSSLISFINTINGGPLAFVSSFLLRVPNSLSKNTILGTIVHTLLEKALLEYKKTKVLPEIDLVCSDIQKLLVSFGLPSKEWSEDEKTVRNFVLLYLAHGATSWKYTDSAEVAINTEHNGIPITGKIDRITLDSDTITLWDYKTGKSPELKTGHIKSWALKQYEIQACFYRLLLSKQFEYKNKKITSCIFLFANTKNSVVEEYIVTITEETYSEFLKLLHSVHSKIINQEWDRLANEISAIMDGKKVADQETSLKFIQWLIANPT